MLCKTNFSLEKILKYFFKIRLLNMQLSYCCPCKITKIEERLLAEKNVSSLYIAKIQNFDPVNNFQTRKVEPIKRLILKGPFPSILG